jgi:uncharacterized DUF497 family protein
MQGRQSGVVRVSWDSRKNTANKRKHGISFEEASVLLESDDHLVLFDEAHSEEEERFISIGPIARGVIVVIWTERMNHEYRIISARAATQGECELFESYVTGKA